jgi:hypothetical protein
MNENIIWSKIDVKNRTIEDISKKAFQYGFDIYNKLQYEMKEKSIRDLTDENSLLDQLILPVNIVKELKKIAESKYIYYRNIKYGNSEFWNSAKRERIIGYEDWFNFINNLINQYTNSINDAILFFGSADGWEIPERKNPLYAIEQIKDSCAELSSRRKDIKTILGDFEDGNLVIGEKFKLIIALRCLMPNTRLNNFFITIENNISANGCLIISHPMKYLYDDELVEIEDSHNKLKAFKKRLNRNVKGSMFKIINDFKTSIEHFFILQRMDDNHEQ